MKRLPKFKSLEEEADFWDKHDVLEYSESADELIIGGPKSETLNIRVEPQVKAKLEEYACLSGEDVSDMVRNWIYLALEREIKERSRQAVSASVAADVSELRRQVEVVMDETNTAVREAIDRYERLARADRREIQNKGKAAASKKG